MCKILKCVARVLLDGGITHNIIVIIIIIDQKRKQFIIISAGKLLLLYYCCCSIVSAVKIVSICLRKYDKNNGNKKDPIGNRVACYRTVEIIVGDV